MPTALGRVVAANIRQLRLQQGWSQQDLAERTGCNRNYIGMLERLENSPTVEMIEKLAIAFSMEPSNLLQLPDQSGGISPMPPKHDA
jgi:transcriptional regulator with XRE-family HTH domain